MAAESLPLMEPEQLPRLTCSMDSNHKRFTVIGGGPSQVDEMCRPLAPVKPKYICATCGSRVIQLETLYG